MDNPFELIEQRLATIEAKLDSLMNNFAKANEGRDTNPSWMNSRQLANYLGLSTTAVGNLRIRKIPYYKIGGRIMYKKEEIDEYIERTRHKSGSEYLNEYLDSKQGRERLSQSKF